MTSGLARHVDATEPPGSDVNSPQDKGVQTAANRMKESEKPPPRPRNRRCLLISLVAASWSLFQLALPEVLLLQAVTIRAVHLAFAMVLVYLSFPYFTKRRRREDRDSPAGARSGGWRNLATALAAGASSLYLAIFYEALSVRQGSPNLADIIVGVVLILLLLEAARRSLGPALPVVAGLFMLYAFFGPYMPDVIAFKGVSFSRFMSQQTISTEGIYGIPLDVSANLVFLFVLLGSMLEKAGGGEYFVDLAFSLLGTFKGGPAKAAVLASGATGLISGSSIANVVTTGTFTIPLMKSVGYPPEKAAAVEVAASTNGQLMPPIMGAAAFIIAEYCNMPYMEVVKAAFVPAMLSYAALFYITHLEAGKLGLKGLSKEQTPRFLSTFLGGIHFLIPIAALLYFLMVERRSPSFAAFWSIMALLALIGIKEPWAAVRRGESLSRGLGRAGVIIWESLVAGGRNMMGIGVAVAGAGIIVGVVTMGLGGLITEVVDVISGGNLYLLLILTAVACLLLGMGLPTTANYIVMATLTAGVIVELAPAAGLEVHLIQAHLFVFFFGILADDTPPVGLAAYAASAIARSNPIATGVQGFLYDVRTAVLPFMFIFNERLLLIGVDSFGTAAWIFMSGIVAMFAFACATQGFFIARNKPWETVIFLLITFMILRPFSATGWLGATDPYSAGFMGIGAADWVKAGGIGLYGLMYLSQLPRVRRARAGSA